MATNNFITATLIGDKTIALRNKYLENKNRFMADACVKYQIAKSMGNNTLKKFFFSMGETYIAHGFLTTEESGIYKNKTKELHNDIALHYGNETLETIVKKFFLI